MVETKVLRLMGVGTLALLAAGCAVPPPMASAPGRVVVAPTAWQAPVAGGLPVAPAWWLAFGDSELAALMAEAEAHNHDIAAAAARVQQAAAGLRIAGAALLPTVTAGADLSRTAYRGDNPYDTDSAFLGLSARYEVDFWGRYRAARESARATWIASGFDRDTVRLGVQAAVANAWLQAVALQERAAIAERNLQDARQLLQLVEARWRAGAATALERAQQRGLASTQQRTLEALRQQADAARSTLAVLTGRTARMSTSTHSLERLTLADAAAGVPSELLARRPDIARAEAGLRAAEADIAVARAAMLPSLSLSASAGTGGSRLRDVFQNPVYSLAAGLAAPIFDAGRLAAGHQLAQARREELLAQYRGAIVAAFADVEVALNAAAALDAQALAQADVLEQARSAATLAESRYRGGAETLLVLLDAQRTLYAAQDLAVQIRLARIQASVALFRALGGGWMA